MPQLSFMYMCVPVNSYFIHLSCIYPARTTSLHSTRWGEQLRCQTDPQRSAPAWRTGGSWTRGTSGEQRDPPQACSSCHSSWWDLGEARSDVRHTSILFLRGTTAFLQPQCCHNLTALPAAIFLQVVTVSTFLKLCSKAYSLLTLFTKKEFLDLPCLQKPCGRKQEIKFSPLTQTDHKWICRNVATLGTGYPEIWTHSSCVIFSISNTLKTYFRSISFLQLKVLTRVNSSCN